MNITQETIENGLIVSLAGKLDGNTTPQHQPRLLQIAGTHPGLLILNLGALVFLSSAGLRAINLVANEVYSHEGKVVIVCHNAEIIRIFELVGFSLLFPIVPTLEEARTAANLA